MAPSGVGSRLPLPPKYEELGLGRDDGMVMAREKVAAGDESLGRAILRSLERNDMATWAVE
jgi:hypothetical protein